MFWHVWCFGLAADAKLYLIWDLRIKFSCFDVGKWLSRFVNFVIGNIKIWILSILVKIGFKKII